MRIYHDTIENNMTTLGNFLVTEATVSFGIGPYKIKNLHSAAKEYLSVIN